MSLSHSRMLALVLLATSSTKAQRAPDDLPPALKLDEANQRHWTVHFEVRVKPAQFTVSRPQDAPASPVILTQGASFVFPLIPDTSMSLAHPRRFWGRLRVTNRPVDEDPQIEAGYQSFSELAIWRMGAAETRLIDLTLETSMTSFETRIDEDVARMYTWPQAPWSLGLDQCLQPQLFVESEDPVVRALVDDWTNGQPRRAQPYTLAKYLAARVVDHVNITHDIFANQVRSPIVGIEPPARSFLNGYQVSGAAFAAREGIGSELDMACLLTAVYRAAGLPARLVIGLDVLETEKSRFPVVRAWTEFFLPKEPKPDPNNPDLPLAVKQGDGQWIPVDIGRQEQFSNRAPPLDQRWQFFGHNEEFDFVAPFSFHWHPPTTVTNAGPPAFWGWLPFDPAIPAADQELRIWAFETPVRGDDPEVRERRR